MKINSTPLYTLINPGSAENFICQKLVNQLNLEVCLKIDMVSMLKYKLTPSNRFCIN